MTTLISVLMLEKAKVPLAMEQATKSLLLRLDSLKALAAWRGAHHEWTIQPASGQTMLDDLEPLRRSRHADRDGPSDEAFARRRSCPYALSLLFRGGARGATKGALRFAGLAK